MRRDAGTFDPMQPAGSPIKTRKNTRTNEMAMTFGKMPKKND